MFNLNSIPIPENNTPMEMSNMGNADSSFPTVGFKSILQSSDLLELLLKPMASPDEIEREKVLNNVNVDNDYGADLESLNFDDLLKPTSKHFDHDYVDCSAKMNQSNPSKSYGNAFLGPSLWEKNEIFQNEKFGVEILDIDEFLNDNNLNEADIKFLDRLQGTENTQPKPQAQPQQQPQPVEPAQKVKVPIYNAPSVTIKVKDDSKIIQNIIPASRKPISSLLSEWNDEDTNDDFSDCNGSTKKFFDERLTLQPTLKKSKKQFVPNDLKDDKYWARRKKNNVAAKRSRDTRRFKENQIVIAATYLEHENDLLRKQLAEANEKIAQMQAKLSRYE